MRAVEIADAQHTAHGTLAGALRFADTVRLTVVMHLGRPSSENDEARVVMDLGGYDAPVLVRGLARAGGK